MSGPPTMIVIDDDSDTLEVLEEYLKIRGLKILATGVDGKEAVELYRKHTPDVVILDIMMPNYDGFYALDMLRQINPNVRVIVVTADVTRETAKLLEETKPSALLYKPYDLESLVDTIQKVKDGQIVVLEDLKTIMG